MFGTNLSSKAIVTGRLFCEKNRLYVKGVSGIEEKIKILKGEKDNRKFIIPKENLLLDNLDPRIRPVSIFEEAFLEVSPLHEEIRKRLKWIPFPVMGKDKKEEFKGWGSHQIFQEMPATRKIFQLEEKKQEEEEKGVKWHIEDLIKDINEDNGTKVYLITGDAGIGKSTLLYALEAFFSQNTDLFPVRVPLNRLSGGEDEIPERWLEELIEGPRSKDFEDLVRRFYKTNLLDTLKGVLKNERSEKMVMLDGFDEVNPDTVSRVLDNIKTMEGVKKVILAGRGYEEVKWNIRKILKNFYREGEIIEVELAGLDEGASKRLLERVMEGFVKAEEKAEEILNKIKEGGNEWLLKYPLMVVGIGLMGKHDRLPDIFDEGSLIEGWLKWSLEEELAEKAKIDRKQAKSVAEVFLMVMGNWIYRVMRRRLELQRGFEIDESVEIDFKESVMRAVNGVFKGANRLKKRRTFLKLFEEIGIDGLWELVEDGFRRGGILTVVGRETDWRVWFNHLVFIEHLFGVGLEEIVVLTDEGTEDEEMLKKEIKFLGSIGMGRGIGFMVWRLKRDGEIEILSKYWDLIKDMKNIGRASGFWEIEFLDKLGINCDDIASLKLWTERRKYEECAQSLEDRDFIRWYGKIYKYFLLNGMIREKIRNLLRNKNYYWSEEIVQQILEKESNDIKPFLTISYRTLDVMKELAKENRIDKEFIISLLNEGNDLAVYSGLVLMKTLVKKGEKFNVSDILTYLKHENKLVINAAFEVLIAMVENENIDMNIALSMIDSLSLKFNRRWLSPLGMALLRKIIEKTGKIPNNIINIINEIWLLGNIVGGSEFPKLLSVLINKGVGINALSLKILYCLPHDYSAEDSLLELMESAYYNGIINKNNFIYPLLKSEVHCEKTLALELLNRLAKRGENIDLHSILPLLQHEDDFIKHLVLELLTTMAEKGVKLDINLILPFLNSKDSLVKKSTLTLLQALSKLGIYVNKDLIFPLLKDETNYVRGEALTLLKFFLINTEDTEYLLNFLKDSDNNVKASIFDLLTYLVEQCAEIDHDLILPYITEDSPKDIKNSALKLLRALVEKNPKIDLNSLNILLNLINNPDSYTQSLVIGILKILAINDIVIDEQIIIPLLQSKEEGIRKSAIDLLKILNFKKKNLIPHIPPQWVSYSVVTNAILNKDTFSLYHLRLYLNHPEISLLDDIFKNHAFKEKIDDNFKQAIKNVNLPIKHSMTVSREYSGIDTQHAVVIHDICENCDYLETITTAILKFWFTREDILDIQILENLRNWQLNTQGLKNLSGSIDKSLLDIMMSNLVGLSEIEKLIISLQMYDSYKKLPQKPLGVASIGGAVVTKGEGREILCEGRLFKAEWLDDIYIIPSVDTMRDQSKRNKRPIPMNKLGRDFIQGMIMGTLYGWRWGGGGKGYVIFLRVYADDDIKSLEGRSAELPFGLIGAILSQQIRGYN